MTALPGTAWNDILAHIQLNHPQIVRGWFSELKPEGLNGGVLYLRTSNDAQVRYLERHCRFAFLEAAQAATGRLVSVAFRCDERPESAGETNGFGLGPVDGELILNPDYTFDHFVTGPCNRLAHAAAVAVAGDPGRAYNPFFVHGPTGMGKTHLLQAVCHSVRAAAPQARCEYISCETFINHFMEAVEQGALHQFRYRYRHVDVLVIDDIQFLAERERSQEEFFHTFNTLHQSQRQVILSADCSPAGIPRLEDRLVSRFNSGLVALMDRPCFETRMAIIAKKAKLRCIDLPEEVVRLMANRFETNIRELEGALTKLDALSHAHSGQITLELAEEAFGLKPSRPVRIANILEVVSARFNVKVADLQGKRRSKAIAHPRHVSMYLARSLTNLSLGEIGGYFGGRDHTTVLHASRSVTDQAARDPHLQAMLDELASEVKNGSF
jgi:chromosomal replication initiator protein